MSRFNPLVGIRCFLTMYNKPGDRELVMSFNPLAGIHCFLTHPITISTIWLNWIVSFNPLAGIRCFLTRHFIRKR